MINFVLLDNCFTNLFNEFQIRYRETFKFGTGHFLEKQSKFQPKYDCFLTFGAVDKNIKSKRLLCRQSRT